MRFSKTSGHFDSSNGVNKCAYYVYVPAGGELKGIIQISHGMCEHIGRYEHFVEFLTDNGYIVCGNDHLGHGNSVSSKDDYGYFAEKDGWSFLVNDLRRLTMIMKRKFPTLPYFMIGHSMGSFIARLYASRFPDELTALVILGTGDDKALGELGVRAARSVAALKGGHFRSEKLNNLMYGVYNDRIENKQTIFDWLTHDQEIVKKFIDDEKTNFMFTASGFVDLTTLLRRISSSQWVAKVPKNLPILFASGTADPVGNYGKGVINVYEKLINEGCNADIKLYPGARHELINETMKEVVFNDILCWIERKRTGYTGNYEFAE
ncbi:MAG: alpha/beta hydrolase [Ruminiclostridium sp.]|nr:alpha/beta hydrolase [Ruminiclostridium sp.]